MACTLVHISSSVREFFRKPVRVWISDVDGHASALCPCGALSNTGLACLPASRAGLQEALSGSARPYPTRLALRTPTVRSRSTLSPLTAHSSSPRPPVLLTSPPAPPVSGGSITEGLASSTLALASSNASASRSSSARSAIAMRRHRSGFELIFTRLVWPSCRHLKFQRCWFPCNTL